MSVDGGLAKLSLVELSRDSGLCFVAPSSIVKELVDHVDDLGDVL